MNALVRLMEVLRRRRPSYLLYLVGGYLWPRLRYRTFFHHSPRRVRAAGTFAGMTAFFLLGLITVPWIGIPAGIILGLFLALARWSWQSLSEARQRRQRLEGARSRLPSHSLLTSANPLEDGATKDRATKGSAIDWQSWEVDGTVRRAVESQREGDELVVLGHIDADGKLLSNFGTFPGFDPGSKEDFLNRSRYDLDLVLVQGWVAIRKNFRGDQRTFQKEWTILDQLAGHARVPTVLAVDEKRYHLTRSFLPGDTLNDLLVRSGARIRLSQTATDPDLEALEPPARLAAILERGTQHLQKAVGAGFVAELERQMEVIHSRGVTGLSLTFSNVAVDPVEGLPSFFDFDDGYCHGPDLGFLFALQRDRDRSKFNRLYDRDLLTEGSARALLATPALESYAPVDLGDGLATRGFWSVDSGTGRWEYLNRRALEGQIEGKRILDLGSHNCVLPLLMLRAGARQVVAVEQSEENCQSARSLEALFHWRDMRSYSLDLKRRDMRAVLTEDWGSFDLVTAFCSLYYLEEEEMAQVVRRAAELAPMMVLQAKNDTRAQATENKAQKSTLTFLKRLLQANGFPQVEEFAPDGFSRPMLLGRKTVAASGEAKRP
ncbi:MAG: methyltransferase domain-containing protein [Deltaproteobacteria bacterium]|nr:methyltransferase domain-containing protein [Deltaproteobacteria bacterium]